MTAHSNPQKAIIHHLLDDHGLTYCDELGIDIEKNTPSPLFRWLCASILMSTRIKSDIAVSAARALADQGWTTPEKLVDSHWEDRVRTLNHAGYARFDERTASMLHDATSTLLDDYRGDLRVLRDDAGYDPQAERERLKAFKGLGDVGVDIFFREAQISWDELYPFADKKALKAAGRLGLPASTKGLARLVDRTDFPRLVAALVRTDLSKDYETIEAEAQSG
ncbi:hypothetical protein [Pararhizobium mangrovi]|uniref:Endonuclease n=1 Tax=Pararhizobium mangrovi TaxID=2590452 RepID=A0A506U686_9HYPH|nr:hypothetical protein [Pararhizobium mangrovi]TPW29873.1 hypothetical protein FJU11_06260 [Pararhizobium mangrovi]